MTYKTRHYRLHELVCKHVLDMQLHDIFGYVENRQK